MSRSARIKKRRDARRDLQHPGWRELGQALYVWMHWFRRMVVLATRGPTKTECKSCGFECGHQDWCPEVAKMRESFGHKQCGACRRGEHDNCSGWCFCEENSQYGGCDEAKHRRPMRSGS